MLVIGEIRSTLFRVQLVFKYKTKTWNCVLYSGLFEGYIEEIVKYTAGYRKVSLSSCLKCTLFWVHGF